MRVVTQPLHDLFILHLLDQSVSRFFVRRIEDKNGIVANPAISGWRRLAFAFQLGNLCPDPRIVIDRELWRREFNDDELRLAVVADDSFGAAVESDFIQNRLIGTHDLKVPATY